MQDAITVASHALRPCVGRSDIALAEKSAAHVLHFVRLTEVPLADLAAHMSDPRLRAHMPLLTGHWGEAEAQAFVHAKEACWARDGLGHWAFLVDGRYVGWGGFQREGEDWDFGLVLRPQDFGLGRRITLAALGFARADPRIHYVTFLLPPSRRNVSALHRLGAQVIGSHNHAGAAFRKYRLETPTQAIGRIQPRAAGPVRSHQPSEARRCEPPPPARAL